MLKQNYINVYRCANDKITIHYVCDGNRKAGEESISIHADDLRTIADALNELADENETLLSSLPDN